MPSFKQISQIKIGKRYRHDLGDVRALADSIDKLGLLHPIPIDPDGRLIAGQRRIAAFKLLGRTTIPVHVVSLDDLLQGEADENSARKDLDPTERWAISQALEAQVSARAKERMLAGVPSADSADGETREIIARAVGTSHPTLRQIGAVVAAAEANPKKFSSVVEDMDRTGNVSKAFKLVKALGKTDDAAVPDWLRPYTLWQFQTPDPRFGKDDYPGRMPGQVVLNLLHYFTDKGDLVIDPMAGGGTTIDVCKHLGRRCLATDLAPVRKDIEKHDILKGYPKGARDASMVLLDPPYWSQKKGEYAEGASQLAGLTLREYNDAMAKIFAATTAVLRPGGHLAVIVSDSRVKGQVYDHAFEFGKALRSQGWQPVERVIVPYTTQQVSAPELVQAREQRRMLRLYRDLIIVRKPV